LDCWPKEMERPGFVRASWLDAADWVRVDLLWVVDREVDRRIIQSAMAQGKALLLPETMADLVGLCREKCCGLFYATAAEAYGCLTYLQQRPDLRQALGRNAKLACNDM
jgi:hypothetical protein